MMEIRYITPSDDRKEISRIYEKSRKRVWKQSVALRDCGTKKFGI